MITITPVGRDVDINITGQKRFGIEKSKVDYVIQDDSHVSLTVGGGGLLALSEISLGGSTPSTIEEFLELWATVFPETNTGNGGTGNFTGLGFEIAATYAAISADTTERLIKVTADEQNNGDGSIWLHDGTTKIFLLTIPV